MGKPCGSRKPHGLMVCYGNRRALSQAVVVELWSWMMSPFCSVSPQNLAMPLLEQWDVIRGSHGAEDPQNLLPWAEICPDLWVLLTPAARGAWPFSSTSDPDIPKPVVLDRPHLLLDAAPSLSLSTFDTWAKKRFNFNYC